MAAARRPRRSSFWKGRSHDKAASRSKHMAAGLPTSWASGDYVTGFVLEQGCDLDKAVVVQRQAPTVQTVLEAQKLSSRSSPTRSSTSLSRCKGRTPVSQTLSEDHRHSTVAVRCQKWSMSLLRVQKSAQMPLVQFTEKLVESL